MSLAETPLLLQQWEPPAQVRGGGLAAVGLGGGRSAGQGAALSRLIVACLCRYPHFFVIGRSLGKPTRKSGRRFPTASG